MFWTREAFRVTRNFRVRIDIIARIDDNLKNAALGFRAGTTDFGFADAFVEFSGTGSKKRRFKRPGLLGPVTRIWAPFASSADFDDAAPRTAGDASLRFQSRICSHYLAGQPNALPGVDVSICGSQMRWMSTGSNCRPLRFREFVS